MNAHTPRRLAAALGAAAITVAATVGFGTTAPTPAHVLSAGGGYGGGGGGFRGGGGHNGGGSTSDDNGQHLGEIKNGNTPGDNGLHTGEPH